MTGDAFATRGPARRDGSPGTEFVPGAGDRGAVGDGRVRGRSLAEAAVAIIWPTASASTGVVLASFIQAQPRADTGLFVFAGHPVPGSVLRESEFRVASGPRPAVRQRCGRERYLPLVSDVLDGLLTLRFLARLRRRFDVVITSGLGLGLLGILLRRLGLARRTVFVIMDYWPSRFGSRVFSWLYRRLYGWCCTHVDFVVDVADTIEDARVSDGIRVPPARRLFCPHPVDAPSAAGLPRDVLEDDSIVWTGAVTPECGFELVIDAVALAARRRPGVTVTVTSYRPFPDSLRQRIAARGLERHFRILGYFRDEAEFNQVVRKHRAGLAPYVPTSSTVKRYAGVARPWTYMANGVPPIITRVPPDVGEIERAGAGLVIEYDAQQLADAMIALLTDDELHERCRQRGLALAQSRAPHVVFGELLRGIGVPLEDVRVTRPVGEGD